MHRRLTFATAALLLALTSCDNGTPLTPAPQPTSNWTRVAGGFTRDYLAAMWVSPSGHIYTGDRLSVVEFDGAEWRRHGLLGNVWDIWGVSDRDIFAVDGGIVHYDGRAWKREMANNQIGAVWGNEEATFAVGYRGQTFRRVDGAWTEMKSPTSYALTDIWGASATDVYAVGEMGTIIHFDGREWSFALSDVERPLGVVVGTSSSNVVAAGYHAITRFDGTSWARQEIGSSDVWGATCADGNSIYLAADEGRLLRFDGQSWHEEDAPEYRINSMASNGRGDTFAALYTGAVVPVTPGAWQPTPEDILISYRSMAAFDGGDAVLGAMWLAQQGKVVSYKGGRPDTESEFPDYVLGVWGTAPNNVFALSSNDVRRYDGVQWNDLGDPDLRYAEAIWGFDENTIVVAGSDTTVAWHDGVSWRRDSLPIPLGDSVRDLWGTNSSFLLATTFLRNVLRFDGTTWTKWHIPDMSLDALSGTSENDVWGINGRFVLHDDGSGWVREPVEMYCTDVVAIAPNDVYVAGDGGIEHFDGRRWTRESMPAAPWLFTIAASPSGDTIWAAGDAGSIFRLDRGQPSASSFTLWK